MAYKKLRDDGYLADTKEDLKNLKEKDMGAECYVIKEAATYKLMSTGEWIKQDQPVANTESSVDLSNYPTKEELKTAINSIQIPSIDNLVNKEFLKESLAAINPIKEGYGEEHSFGLMVDSSDNKTLIQAMLEKGKTGMYNFHIEKGSPGLPEEVVAKNSSCRGIACVDTYRSDSNWYGWILMYDQDGDVYTQYIRNAEPKGWKRLVTI